MKTLFAIFMCALLAMPVYADSTTKCGGTIEFVKPGDQEVIDILYSRVKNRKDIQVNTKEDKDRLKTVVLSMSRDRDFIDDLNRDIEMDIIEGKRNFFSKDMESHEFDHLRKTVTNAVNLRKQCLSQKQARVDIN